MTAAEVSEYVNDIDFNIDLTGSDVGTASVTLEITVIYTGFLTSPTIAGL